MLSRKITIIFFLTLTIFSFGQCKTIKNGNAGDKESKTLMIQENKKDSKLNGDKTMNLVIKKKVKSEDPATFFEYIVYNQKTREIIKKGSFRGSDIDWYDNNSLQLIPYIGIEQKPISDNPEDFLSSENKTQITIIKLNY
ncbi:hypothetical protein [Aquimarina muelleri]|uniref:Uncharacterized protein n=1 Tax=Aquimarina muelleri TaxID=279356 RepID=A0A918JXP2_9FLAO|nr:hypothetical protein [Aquimarina muelleri]MCX2764918.1 hypothetical protein [Aquimarina muelleri]GGX30658.1 hypothetical protein GCM10007384_34710 [Aquimarina muelleri]